MNINEFHPTSGRFVKEDGTTVNIADELGGKSVSDKVYDIDNMMPHSGRFIKEDGTCVNIADMIANGDIGGGGGSDSGSLDDSAPPIVETYNGQTIQCSMSADRPLKGLNLYATCKQKTTTGANLFDESEWSKKTASGITIEWLQDEGCFLLNGTVTETVSVRTSIDMVAEKGATYTLQNCYVSGKMSASNSGIATTFFGSSDTGGSTSNWLSCRLIDEDRRATEQCNYSHITAFGFYVTTGVVLNNYKIRIQLAKSSAPLPYEPYTGGIPSPNVDYPQEIQTISDFVVEVKNSMGEGATPQTLNITIPEQGFYGIPVESGGNYTDSSGQQWVCDEFDFERGVYVRRIGIETINGGYNFFETLDVPGRFRENRAGFTNLYKNGDYESICNIALWTRWAISRDATVWRFALSGDTYYLRPPVSSGINNATELNAFLNDLGVRLVLVGQLESPIEYDLTDEQIEQYKKLRSYYGTTYIDNDAVPACNMMAELVVDTKMYIDSKFTTLAGQILEMGV